MKELRRVDLEIKSPVSYLLVSEMQSQEEILEVWFNSRTTAVIGVSGRIFQHAKLLENTVGCVVRVWACPMSAWWLKIVVSFCKSETCMELEVRLNEFYSKMSLQERASSVHKWSRLQAICIDSSHLFEENSKVLLICILFMCKKEFRAIFDKFSRSKDSWEAGSVLAHVGYKLLYLCDFCLIFIVSLPNVL